MNKSEIFSTHVLFHTHIEKTAGTSLSQGMTALLGKDHVHDIREKTNLRPRDMSEEEMAQVHLLTGHFGYGRMERFFERTPIYVAAVRDPYERFKSYYLFISKRPGHPGYKKIDGRSLGDTIEHYIQSGERSVRGAITRKLAGFPQASAADAIDSAEKNYLIVAPYHRVNDLLKAFYTYFGAEFRFPYRKNVGHSNKLPDENREMFDKINADDIEVCRRVEENFDRWLDDFEARFERALQARARTAA